MTTILPQGRIAERIRFSFDTRNPRITCHYIELLFLLNLLATGFMALLVFLYAMIESLLTLVQVVCGIGGGGGGDNGDTPLGYCGAVTLSIRGLEVVGVWLFLLLLVLVVLSMGCVLPFLVPLVTLSAWCSDTELMTSLKARPHNKNYLLYSPWSLRAGLCCTLLVCRVLGVGTSSYSLGVNIGIVSALTLAYSILWLVATTT